MADWRMQLGRLWSLESRGCHGRRGFDFEILRFIQQSSALECHTSFPNMEPATENPATPTSKAERETDNLGPTRNGRHCVISTVCPVF